MAPADFGRVAEDYARFRVGFPDSFYDEVFRRGLVRAGDRLIDLGTGTGTLALGFAVRGCEVTGLDVAPTMLDQAKRLAAAQNLSVAFTAASAEATGLPAHAFDVVVAGQCWHWFDRPRAAVESRRMLAPGGRLIIAHFDWLPVRGTIALMTERLIASHNSQWQIGGQLGSYPEWIDDLKRGGFTRIDSFQFDVDVGYSHEAWRGRMRAAASVGGSLPEDAVKRFDQDLEAVLREMFPETMLVVPHRVWAAFGSSPT